MKRENPIVLVWVYSHNNLKGLKQTIKSFFDSTYIAKLIFIEDDNSENQKEIQLFVDSAMQQGLTGYFNTHLNHIGLIERLKDNTLIKKLDFDYILTIDDKCILGKSCISNLINHYGDTLRCVRDFYDKFPLGWCFSKVKFDHLVTKEKNYWGGEEVTNAIIHINNSKESKKFKKLKDMVGKIWKK